MKKSIMWLRMLAKRQFKKISLYVILAVLFVTCFLIKYVADNFTIRINIGVVNQDDGLVSGRVEDSLYSHRGIINFVEYDSEEELKEDVAVSEIMGGYILKDNFSKKIISGDTGEIMEAVTTPNSMTGAIANEIFFSYIMKELSYEELVQDTKDTGLFEKMAEEEIRESLRAYYLENLSNGSTFSLDYLNDVDGYQMQVIELDKYIYDYISPVIIGLIGLFIFIGGMCGAISCYDDEKKGTLTLLKPAGRKLVAVFEIAIPVFTVTLVGVITILLTGMSNNLPETIIKYVLYGMLVVAYCYIQKTVIRKKEIYISFIPVFVLMSLIFCPIFMNIAAFAPNLGIVGKFFPVYWLYKI